MQDDCVGVDHMQVYHSHLCVCIPFGTEEYTELHMTFHPMIRLQYYTHNFIQSDKHKINMTTDLTPELHPQFIQCNKHDNQFDSRITYAHNFVQYDKHDN